MILSPQFHEHADRLSKFWRIDVAQLVNTVGIPGENSNCTSAIATIQESHSHDSYGWNRRPAIGA